MKLFVFKKENKDVDLEYIKKLITIFYQKDIKIYMGNTDGASNFIHNYSMFLEDADEVISEARKIEKQYSIVFKRLFYDLYIKNNIEICTIVKRVDTFLKKKI